MAPRSMNAYCDGAARGNPGPAGIGVLITDSEGAEVDRLQEFVGRRTNNQAEYEALIRALETSSEHTTGEVTCWMDSELVVKQLRGEYRVKAQGLRDAYRRVKELESDFESVEYQHLSREDERMKTVDALANRAIDTVLSAGVLS